MHRFTGPAIGCALFCLIALHATPAAGQSAALPAGVERVTSVEGITEYRLANGLKVLLFPDASKPTITVNITYLVGSRHESYGETGMAHLLEHMLFKGTPRNPTIVDQFSKRGARINATTSVDRTNYFEIFPGTAENLKWAIELEADRMVNSNIARADLDSEMTVVRNEYERGENEPGAVLFKRMLSVAFDWHNYQNSTIGNRSDIENVGVDNLRAFYRTYYQPDNAVLLVAGNFDEAEALRLAADAFGAIPKPARVLPRFWTVEPTQDGERAFTVRRKGDVQLVLVAYKIPGALHADADAVAIAAQILGSAPSGRLHKALVEGGKANSVASLTFAMLDPGLVAFLASVKKDGSAEEAQKALIEAIEGFAARPPTGDEMQRTRSQFAKAAEQAWSSPEASAIALSEAIAKGDWRIFFHERQRIQKILADEVTQAARKYLRRDNRTVGVFLPTDDPQRAQIAPAPAAQAVLKDFKGEEAMAAGESFDPAPANIDARTRLAQLPGGLKLALLPKKTRGSTVHVRIALHWGDVDSLFGKSATAGLMSAMLSRGTTRYTRQQVSDRLDQLKASGQVNGQVTTMRTTRENLPEVLRLVAHLLRQPSFPESELEQLKKLAVSGIEQRRNEPGTRANQAISAHLDIYKPGDWRHSPTSDEAIEGVKAVTRDGLVDFHRGFLGATHGEMAVVGDFDEKEILAVIQEELGNWKTPAPYKRVEIDYRDKPAIAETIEIPDKANAVFVGRLLLNLRDDDPAYPEYPALYLANYMLGGGAGLSSRMSSRIRGKEGLTYGVSTSLSSNSLDRVTTFGATATAAPQNMERLVAIFREELERAVKDGFTDEELANAKSGLLQQRVQTRAQDDAIAASWVDKLYRGKTFAESAEYDAKLQAVTREDILAALRKHIDVAKMSFAKAGSFAAAK